MHASPDPAPPLTPRAVAYSSPVRPVPSGRKRRFKPLRRLYRKMRRWYRTSQTKDIVTTFVCLIGVVLLAVAGVGYLLLH